MSGFLLDTNVLSEFNRRGQPDRWSNSGWKHPTSALFTRVSSRWEKYDGVELLPPSKRRTQLEQWLDRDLPEWFEGRILTVDQPIADRWGLLRAEAQMNGRPLSVVDGLLAATAVQHSLTIVSRNVSDFAAVELAVFNPWENRV